MNIVVVSWDYPDEQRTVFPFVKKLVDEWARQGHACTVIAPFSITTNKRFLKYETARREGNDRVAVIRPNYVSLSTFRFFGVSLSDFFHKKAVQKGLSSLDFKPDLIYCHFWKSAVESYDYATHNNIPLFVATGESTIEDIQKRDAERLRNTVKGVIAVSSKNKEESVSLMLASPESIKVIPNAIDSNLFKLLNKIECREKIQIPQGTFVVIFVGWFDNRKGAQRVAKALDSIIGENVYSIFVGKGAEEPECKNILFKGSLKHDEIPVYLNAADCFVLPTLHEGCCNAIVEAMACGLPIISSDLPFNKDICNDTNSILCDPLNIVQIRGAITSLRDNINLRMRLSEGSLNMAKSLTIDKRASSIIEFMRTKLK